MTVGTVLAELNAALHGCFEADERVVLWGEDVLSPYGGAFKVTAGLSERFPQRVFTTPISEAAIVGIAVGAALRGLRPVVELMFGDFVGLAADQLINHAAKFAGMFNGHVTVPMVVRAPMGGYRGYGPTHSQSLEKHFLGVPGLRVIAVSCFHAPGGLLRTAILDDPMPVLFVENKLLYPQAVRTCGGSVLDVSWRVGGSRYPVARVANFLNEAPPDVTIVTYGGMSMPLEKALLRLADEEIRCEAFLPADISCANASWLEASCARTRRLLAVEETTAGFGYAAQIISDIAARLAPSGPIRFRVLNAADSVIPAAKSMELAMLPSAKGIVESVFSLL
ncbi:MAG: alpha-ketoacid dehydrogenase subunit beta [Chloroflexi bacterium]|nr:alpha-ketoacid dehydrogenase subunit beta [Chloroflexota bacterium]